jgi:indole-3-glycerol phosphate synthase
MSILDQILAHKITEVAARKELYPVPLLEKSIYFKTPVVSLSRYIARPDLSGIIAEIKRKSPARGDLHPHLDVEALSIGYMQAGAAALSILTDEKYFGGSNADLTTARRFNFCPILRKEFIIDEYQLIEAKSCGADAVLLIAAALTPDQVAQFSRSAHNLGLEVVLEIHNEAERAHIPNAHVDIIGVNNRDLSTLAVSLTVSENLIKNLPVALPKISESGIDSPQDLLRLRGLGFQGFLIGERFLRSSDPARAAAQFIEDCRSNVLENKISTTKDAKVHRGSSL